MKKLIIVLIVLLLLLIVYACAPEGSIPPPTPTKAFASIKCENISGYSGGHQRACEIITLRGDYCVVILARGEGGTSVTCD